MKAFWKGLGRTARVALVAGVVAIVAATAALGWWLLRTDYQVLFADLSPQDAAAITAELERQKVPYALAEDGAERGTTIRVDRRDVYRTRMKVMGKDLPLHGAVGFELFNNSDFGMTEFAQKINYQRALQGELTRTILSLSEIRDVRVLLALPEQGLFKQATSKAKASITLALRRGQTLRAEQVAGIQRLVSAAVPGIASQDVTIVDQSGVALTRAPGETDVDPGSGRLELKKETEEYLARKAVQVLERALGAGQALASVDVTLDMDRVQTTTEDVVAAPGKGDRGQTGVVVRERETSREVAAPLARGSADGSSAPVGGSSQREVEYAVGRRVEQVMSQPGSIRRLHVVAVVRKALDAAQERQIRDLVAASVGASPERGDTVVVQPMDALPAPVAEPLGAAAPLAERAAPAPQHGWSWASARGELLTPSGVELAVLGLAVLVAAVVLWRAPTRRRPAPAPAPAPLSDAQRQATLVQLKAWMRADAGRAPRELS
ncbi:MAG TPA: flagellar basal-body MS-ring/collar protein FliF [Anaeromyxobacter sp.]|jgi:flagellar M-ring protein FliF|nr:flagellar basal-body MS-ring/collar protein FliF [Anaeromyxobacter sp.]